MKTAWNLLLSLLIACCSSSLLTVDGGLQDANNKNIDQNITWITPAHNYYPPHHQQPILLRHQYSHIRHHYVHHWGPFFEEVGINASDGGQLALQVPLGGSVRLNCRVGMLHDKTVMWLRRYVDRVVLLTVGAVPYSSDPRLKITFQYPNNWQLQISPVQREDEGQYMCQVSTHPPRVLAINVTVLAPELKVVDEHGHSVHDRYYKTGSTIELTCRVITSAEQTASSQVTWTKDGSKLPDKVTTSPVSETKGGTTVSRLVIPRAAKSDSGTYSCSLSKHSSVRAHVHVLNGEKQAAVQHDTWGSTGCPRATSQFVLVLVFAASFAIKHH
ncbi:zwei Ig domain protein zig-8-like isoform X2 [Zootermopsis nevadensis]|uniref:zwei Ig domain protein zig-8-like isoform X2 n=1 Tax=Zootermopsis nevadensis TaxID=136037 RepID=UPI000B8E3433|nr:zwei Ig domain protein zig-8-like isoform X2 [Zootermopsis nevadensis]